MRHARFRSAALAAFAVVLLALAAAAPPAAASENWPAFRGADAMSTADDDPRLPITWSTTENVVWKTPIPGLGWSSPVVWGDRIFLTTVISEGEEEEPRMGLYFPYGSPQPMPSGGRFRDPEPGDLMERSAAVHHWLVQAIDFNSGDVLWTSEVHTGRPDFDRHLKNTYASSTPVTDGERVYAYFGNVGVYALDMEGAIVWERRFEATDTRLGWGPAASPVLHDGTLYVVNDNDEQSFLVALDAETGVERWRDDREEGTNWSTPFVWEHEGRTEIVTTGSDLVRSYDPDGRELWSFRGMNSISIPQPFAAHGLLYVMSGYVGDAVRPVYAIRPGAEGDITLPEGGNQQRLRGLVSGCRRAVPSDAAGLRRPLHHAARPGILHGARRAHRRGAVLHRAADPDAGGAPPRGARGDRLHVVAVGIQRDDLPAQRGRRHLRARQQRPLPAGRHQRAGRGGHVDPGHRPREPVHPDPLAPVEAERPVRSEVVGPVAAGPAGDERMHHKRKRAKHRRAGCLLCKPHKRSGWPKLVKVKGRRGLRALNAVAAEAMQEADGAL